jgi:AraC family transcriptional regulator
VARADRVDIDQITVRREAIPVGDAQIEQVGPAVVAFVEIHGPYAQMPEAFRTLYGWMGAHGLTPIGMPRGVFLTDPATTPENEAVWELQSPVAGDPADAGADESGCGVKHLGAHTDAWVLYRGTYGSMGPAYSALSAWIAEHGYAISGPPMEVYLSDPSDTAPEDNLTEVRFPVRAR